MSTEAVSLEEPAAYPQCPLHPAFFIAPGGACPECNWKPEESTSVSIPAEGEVVDGELMEVAETFEGTEVSEWELRLPAQTIECDRSFKRGSILKLAVEVRLRNVTYNEKRDETLVRVHNGVIEDISVLGVYTPGEASQNVLGSASGDAEQGDDSTE